MSNFEKLDRIIQEHGKEGLRFLFLFKILKSQTEAELKKRNLTANQTILDDVCAEAADKLLLHGKKKIDETTLREILLKLTRSESYS
jgi:hypothetical protein